MKVTVKELSAEIELKNKGMELDVYDKEGNHLGDLVVTKSGLTWCKGKTSVANGTKLSWPNAIALFEGEKKQARKKAARKVVAKKAAAKPGEGSE